MTRPACDYTDIFCSLDNAKSYLLFIQSLDRIMSILKHDIGSSPMAFIKLCRVLKHFHRRHVQLSSPPGKAPSSELAAVAGQIEDIRLKIIKEYLVVGLPLLECNPGAVSEVWALMEVYDFHERYQIYEDWFTKLVAV